MDPDRRHLIEGYEFAQGPGRFHVALTLRLQGELDVARLETALGLTSARHDALRARLAPRDGNPYRLELTASPALALPVEDVAASELDAVLDATIGARLSLSTACVRARLLRTDANTHVLVLVLHRCVCDEASLDVLHRDLLLAYAGTPLAPPTQVLGRGETVDAVAVEAARERATADGHVAAHSCEQFFASSDVLSLHLRLTDTTRGIVKHDALSHMKPTSLLVNTSRAELIEEGALVSALNRGRPGMAAVDVFEAEPILQGHLLLRLENAVCTPHIGYVEQDSYELYFRTAFENVVNFIHGTPTHILNPDALKVMR